MDIAKNNKLEEISKKFKKIIADTIVIEKEFKNLKKKTKKANKNLKKKSIK